MHGHVRNHDISKKMDDLGRFGVHVHHLLVNNSFSFPIKKTYNRSTHLQIPHDFCHSRNRPDHHIDRQRGRLVRLHQNRHRRAGIPAVKSRGKRSRRVAADQVFFSESLFDLVRIESVRNTFANRFSRASCARWRPFRLHTRMSRCSFSLYCWNASCSAYAAL